MVLVGAGLWTWQYLRDRLGESTVLAALDDQLGAGRVRFTAVALEPVSSTEQERTLRFSAQGALTGDLFVRRDTEETLRERFADSLDRLAALTEELATPAGTRLVELAELGQPPADPLALVLLERTAAGGTALTATGQLTATRGAEGWVLEVAPGEYVPALPLGKLRSGQPENALVTSDPTFPAALEQLVATRLAFAEKLAAARAQVAEQLRQERDARQTAFLVALQPGNLFLGHAEPLADGEPVPGLVLEIATAKPAARQVTALLRNQGNWTDTRVFSATWETDDDFSVLRLPLATRSSQAVPEAGPLLSLRETWTVELSLDAEGRLTGQSPTHQYTFTRVASGDLERTRTELAAAHEAVLAATRPGTTYHGTVAAGSGGASTPAFLRFIRQDNSGARLEAELELAAQPGRLRLFRGFAAANPHRTGDRPIRLSSEARRRVAKADPASVTGFAMDLAPAFALDGATLTGADDSFTYSFTRITDAEFGQLVAARQSAEAGILAIVKRGAAYDGVARHRDGFTTPIRLRFTRVDDDGTVAAHVESRQRQGVHLRLSGPVDTATRKLQLAGTGGRPDTDDDLRVPFLVRNAKYTLRLDVGERAIEGTIEHDPDWTLSFNLGPAVPTELPAWPTAGGAYALVGDAWHPLPANTRYSGNSATARPAKAGSGKAGPVKVAELVFDGKDPVPAIPQGAPVVVVYVGPVPPPSAELLEKYPDTLRDYPAVELAPTRKTLIGGKRIADLFRVTPENAGFLASRVAATLTEPETEITLLVANVALPPGGYALLANGNAFELQVK